MADNLIQKHFRWRIDGDAVDTEPTWGAAEDVAIDLSSLTGPVRGTALFAPVGYLIADLTLVSSGFTARQVALFTPSGIVEINQTLTVQSAVGFVAELNQVSG